MVAKSELIALLNSLEPEQNLLVEVSDVNDRPKWADTHERLTIYLSRAVLSQLQYRARTKDTTAGKLVASLVKEALKHGDI